MYPPVPRSPQEQPGGIGVNERQLADRCLGGDIAAGERLVEMLWQKGNHVGITGLVRIACPDCRPSVLGFDALSDALDLFRRARLVKYRRENAPKDDAQRPESD